MRQRSDFYVPQKLITDFIKDKPNCAVHAGMGTGKTVSSLTAFQDLQNNFDAQRALVVAPLRVARKVWSDEIDEWSHLQGITVAKIIGTEKQRLEAMRTRADIHTINRENVAWLERQIIEGKKQIRIFPWDTVILDESQSFKSQNSQRWKSLRRLRKLFHRCIQLTGTPIPNGYGDLWAPVYLLDQGQRLGSTESAFHDRWFNERRGDGFSVWDLKPGAEEFIQHAISDITLSVRLEDYIDVPAVTWNLIRVVLSAAEMAIYRRFERTCISEFNGKTVSAVSAGALGNKLAQLANGFIYSDDEQNFEIFHDQKVDALGEVLDGLSGPVIVGYAYRADAERIGDLLTKMGKKWRFANSDADLNAFANGTLDVIVMHPASAGHGLNDLYKSGAAHIVWFGLTANLEWFQQLNARLTGGLRMLGRHVTVHVIVADDTRDKKLLELLTSKDQTQAGLGKGLSGFARNPE